MPLITNVYRTEGRYELIVKVTAQNEEKLKEVVNDIDKIAGVDATVSLTVVK